MKRRAPIAARAALFDVGPAGEQWTGSRALVPWTPGRCPQCGGQDLRETTVGEYPLLRAGGYGAARETVTQTHSCGYWRTIRTTEVNPRW